MVLEGFARGERGSMAPDVPAGLESAWIRGGATTGAVATAVAMAWGRVGDPTTLEEGLATWKPTCRTRGCQLSGLLAVKDAVMELEMLLDRGRSEGLHR